jgi:hypothetical protein
MRDSTQHVPTEQRKSLTDAELLAMIDAGWSDTPQPSDKPPKRQKKRPRGRGR